MHLTLVHSPLVGSVCWQAMATVARASGHEATVVTLPSWADSAPDYYAAMGSSVAGQVSGQSGSLLVVHSGAGALVPSILAASQGEFAQVIYVDAILPHPGRCWCETAADNLVAVLEATLSQGCVPAWDQWFPPGTLAGLLPDQTRREAFAAGLAPTPWAYLQAKAPDPDWPEHVGWSYLRLSRAYEDEAGLARHEGRPALRLDLHHLAMMTDPQEILLAIMNLARGRS